MQIIFILGGGIIEDDHGWRTTTFFEEGDGFGALGDRLRVDAARVLYSKSPEETLLIPSGGKGQLREHPTAPTVASVIAHELTQLGISRNILSLDEASNNTYEQLQTLKKLIDEYKWGAVTVLTNQWHISRTRAFVKLDEVLRSYLEQRQIELVSAEDVLMQFDPQKWQKMIIEVYNSEAMRKRIKKEQQGIQAINEGSYKFS